MVSIEFVILALVIYIWACVSYAQLSITRRKIKDDIWDKTTVLKERIFDLELQIKELKYKQEYLDKSYIRDQAQKGLAIDSSKLKAGKIARVSL